MPSPVSLYVHLPFCLHKCSYCDLTAYAGLNDLIPRYMAALEKEARGVGRGADFPIHTLYLGGGTPSVVPVSLLARLIDSLGTAFQFTPGFEFSFEANPETLTGDYVRGLRSLGVNRLSLGAQSAQPAELRLYQRTHTWDDVTRALTLAREHGFDNISLDLMYGAPGQTLSAWEDTLAKALQLAPDHVSVYALCLDFNTPLRAWVRRGRLAEPDDEVSAAMYERADTRLAEAGYAQYELSSWARRPAAQCRHNLQYWRNLPYLGLGAGAHGHYGGYRYSNISNPAAYIRRIESGPARPFPFSPALADSIPIDRETEMKESLLTGLRLVTEGVDAGAFEARFGVPLRAGFGRELRRLEARRLLEWRGEVLRLTDAGRFVSNWVFENFV